MASSVVISRMEYIKEDNIYLLYPKKDINNLKFKL